MWKQADSDVSILIEFLLNGQLVIPDAGSIKLTLRDNLGGIISGYNSLAQADVTTPQLLLSIPAADNGIAADAEFETRYGIVQFSVNSVPCFKHFSYNLVAFLPLTVTPENVRALVGAEYEELPDEDIDLIKAYFDLKETFGSNFTDALTATGVSKLNANESVAIRCALNVFPSLQSRLLAGEKTDATEYTRQKLNLDKLQRDLENSLNLKLTAIAQSTLTTPTLFIVTSPTDPVTNS